MAKSTPASIGIGIIAFFSSPIFLIFQDNDDMDLSCPFPELIKKENEASDILKAEIVYAGMLLGIFFYTFLFPIFMFFTTMFGIMIYKFK